MERKKQPDPGGCALAAGTEKGTPWCGGSLGRALLAHHVHKQDEDIKRLRGLLQEAREDIADWAGYADAYFQEKWDLAGTLAKYDAVLASPSSQEPEGRE